MFAICKQETLLSRCHACANQHSGNKFCQALVSPTGHLSLSRCLPCPGSLDLEVTRTGDHTDVCWHSENQLTVHWEQLLQHTCLSEMPFPHQDEAWSWSLFSNNWLPRVQTTLLLPNQSVCKICRMEKLNTGHSQVLINSARNGWKNAKIAHCSTLLF